ncbi:MAG: type I restriction enzyme HsdR N-terminal domain-containing protein [Raineya sp.]|nr:type I restriction enzyme HsdR N-terminal domain-containing protein [Raineya sp.]MDW8296385.1 type I restriction enzyme HsdR N-terminal domain-containing protein [Raineya sp.]
MIQNLNLPTYEHQIIRKNDKLWIFDVIRKKYVLLTPEEWVRQQIICWLVEEYDYPKSLMQIEKEHYYHHKAKRTDIVIYDRVGNPFMLVECKSMNVTLSQAVCEQAFLYNQTLQAPYILLTNGLCFVLMRFSESGFVFLEKIPEFA